MRRLFAPVALVAVLALAGCSGGDAAADEPSPAPTVEVVASVASITTLDEGITYVLAQAPGSMTSNDILNAAQKLRNLAGEEYSNAKLGKLPVELLGITLDALKPETSEAVLQARLVELTKQLRELG